MARSWFAATVAATRCQISAAAVITRRTLDSQIRASRTRAQNSGRWARASLETRGTAAAVEVAVHLAVLAEAVEVVPLADLAEAVEEVRLADLAVVPLVDMVAGGDVLAPLGVLA